ncbi:MAG: bifunctional adenosylcobinamide kinase/adenosylcobinamide-phosphate guanylyltransferase [Treponema sp.]|nr:bifunctional adenosylcobinamide kinase/adenosylcobinamide-phosphate guanylyltransferase [Treponema sp.]
MITLLTGGVKSGKSRRALDLALSEWKPSAEKPVFFIATSEIVDDEMKARIARHRTERAELAGEGSFTVIEEPIALDRAVKAAGQRCLVDCLPMWVNNLMYHKREEDFRSVLEAFIDILVNENRDCIVVSNETGLGNVPFDEITRRYNVLLAEANRKVAAAAGRVELMISGIPLRIK